MAVNESVQVIVPQDSFGYYVLILGLAVIVAALLAWIHWVNVKNQKDEKKNKERSPMLTAAFVTATILFLALAAAALGMMDRDWLQQHWYVFSLIFVTAYLLLMFEAKQRQPKPIRLLKALALDAVDEELGFESDDWKNDGYVPTVDHMKVMEDEGLRGLRSSVAYFVVYRMWRTQKRRFLVGLNTYTGYPLEIKLMPEQHRIDSAMMEKPATPAGETDAES